jgi:hypothetical protein
VRVFLEVETKHTIFAEVHEGVNEIDDVGMVAFPNGVVTAIFE